MPPIQVPSRYFTQVHSTSPLYPLYALAADGFREVCTITVHTYLPAQYTHLNQALYVFTLIGCMWRMCLGSVYVVYIYRTNESGA